MNKGHLHESPAEERDTDHKRPAWHFAKVKDHVSNRDVDAELRQRAVEGMPVALIDRHIVPLLLQMQARDLRRSDGCSVEVLGSHGRGGGVLVGQRLREQQLQDLRRSQSPGVAQHSLRLAVDHRQVGRGA